MESVSVVVGRRVVDTPKRLGARSPLLTSHFILG
jgi:hypothetical protein